MELLSALTTFSTFLIGTFFAYYKWNADRKDKKKSNEIDKLKQENLANVFSLGILQKLLKMKLFGYLEKVTERVLMKTKVTRVLIFVAINGKLEPKKVYALFGDKIKEKDIEQKFKNVMIDHDYVRRLHDLESKGCAKIDVLKMEEGLLKNIYWAEELSYSYLKFIKRYQLTNEDDALVYMSFATDSDEDFTDIELTNLNLEVSNEYAPLIDKIVK